MAHPTAITTAGVCQVGFAEAGFAEAGFVGADAVAVDMGRPGMARAKRRAATAPFNRSSLTAKAKVGDVFDLSHAWLRPLQGLARFGATCYMICSK
jgi:hypothetical protein